jgi:hypothetical protein
LADDAAGAARELWRAPLAERRLPPRTRRRPRGLRGARAAGLGYLRKERWNIRSERSAAAFAA